MTVITQVSDGPTFGKVIACLKCSTPCLKFNRNVTEEELFSLDPVDAVDDRIDMVYYTEHEEIPKCPECGSPLIGFEI